MGNPVNAGPNNDGSRSLAKESRAGLAVAFVLSILGTGAVDWLTNLDTSSWSGWWAHAAVLGVSGLAGAIAAWLKKNR
jgi:hypothetical protein